MIFPAGKNLQRDKWGDPHKRKESWISRTTLRPFLEAHRTSVMKKYHQYSSDLDIKTGSFYLDEYKEATGGGREPRRRKYPSRSIEKVYLRWHHTRLLRWCPCKWKNQASELNIIFPLNNHFLVTLAKINPSRSIEKVYLRWHHTRLLRWWIQG